VTEPVEFTFMFLAPVLYALHAIATGLAMVIMDLFGVHLGFSFSAGLFDYVLNFTHAQRPLLLIPIGAAYFLLYYVVFRFCIVRLNLPTPGRESDEAPQMLAPLAAGTRGSSFVTALGGAGNLTEVTACTTRLRLGLVDNCAIDEPALKRLGSRGLLRSGATGLQVVLGPIADQVAGEMRDAMRARAGTQVVQPNAPARRDAPAVLDGAPAMLAEAPALPADAPAMLADAPAVLAALGGRQNVRDLEIFAGRLSMFIADRKAVDEGALMALGIRGVAHPTADSVQLLIAGPAEAWVQPLRRLL
jgi:PTS system N-acetylglucosamine-specific IIC component